MIVDKNQAVIKYLLQCPTVKNNSLFFNFADEKDNSNQIVTRSDDTALDTSYVDGSILKQFSFTMYIYKSVAYNPVVKQDGFVDENVADVSEVQKLIDWVVEQNDNKVFPNFGESCIIESVEPTTNRPKLNGVSVEMQPPLAQYQVIFNIKYLDISKTIWNN